MMVAECVYPLRGEFPQFRPIFFLVLNVFNSHSIHIQLIHIQLNHINSLKEVINSSSLDIQGT